MATRKRKPKEPPRTASGEPIVRFDEPPELGRKPEKWTKTLDPHAGDKYGEFWGNECWVIIAPWNEVARHLTSGVDNKVDPYSSRWVEPLARVEARRRDLWQAGYRLEYVE